MPTLIKAAIKVKLLIIKETLLKYEDAFHQIRPLFLKNEMIFKNIFLSMYSEPCQRPKMELFAKVAYSFPLDCNCLTGF